MRHGYTNHTRLDGDAVYKSYLGPDADLRASAELAALTSLRGLVPVPAVRSHGPGGPLVTEVVAGRQGQELIDDGRADRVLRACGQVLRVLQDLDPGVLRPGPHAARSVVVHGDFGPQNVLLDPADHTITAVLDWEFSGVGTAIADVAWCEWIVRTHHPQAVASLASFFDAYGERPPWAERRAAMLERCVELTRFCERGDPAGAGVTLWRERSRVTAAWTESGSVSRSRR